MHQRARAGKHFRNKPPSNSLIKQYGYASLKTLNIVKNVTNHYPKRAYDLNLTIKEPTTIDAKIGRFWNQIKDDYNFRVERDNSFINWRYRDGRGGKYTLRYAYENDNPVGYTALRVNKFKDGYPEGYIVELLTPPDRQDIADALIRDATQFFEEKEVNLINAIAIKGHPSERTLSRHGYLQDRNRLIISIKSIGLEDNLGPLFKSPLTRLHFNYGDSDWI